MKRDDLMNEIEAHVKLLGVRLDPRFNIREVHRVKRTDTIAVRTDDGEIFFVRVQKSRWKEHQL